jgi:two-component sensor histidine kinase
MPSNGPPQHDPEWLQSQWNELSDILSVSDPDQVVDQVRELQDQVDTLTDQQEALVEAGMKDSEQALRMIENMADQLEELYAERVSDT